MYEVTGESSSQVVTDVQAGILTEIINPILSVATAFALVWMMYGIIRFILLKDKDASEMERGKKHILWSIVGLFIIMSIWGIMITLADMVDSNVWFAN